MIFPPGKTTPSYAYAKSMLPSSQARKCGGVNASSSEVMSCGSEEGKLEMWLGGLFVLVLVLVFKLRDEEGEQNGEDGEVSSV